MIATVIIDVAAVAVAADVTWHGGKDTCAANVAIPVNPLNASECESRRLPRKQSVASSFVQLNSVAFKSALAEVPAAGFAPPRKNPIVSSIERNYVPEFLQLQHVEPQFADYLAQSDSERQRFEKAAAVAELQIASIALAASNDLLSRNFSSSNFSVAYVVRAVSFDVGQLIFICIAGIVVLLVSFMVSIWFYGTHRAGKRVKDVIESIDRDILGVDVEIGLLTANLFNAQVNIRDLIMLNPAGYSSPYLMKVDTMFLDLDMLRLIFSLGKDIVVERLVLRNVSIILEKKWTTSNVQEILDFVSKEEDVPEETCETSDIQEQPNADVSREIHLQVVNISGVRMKFAVAALGAAGIHADLADLNYDNFSEEIKQITPKRIALFLFKTILKSATRAVHSVKVTSFDATCGLCCKAP